MVPREHGEKAMRNRIKELPRNLAYALPSLVLSVALLFFGACSLTDAHLRQGPGTDYFRPEFGCGKEAINAERDQKHLLLRDKLRQEFPVPQRPPFLVLSGESTVALLPAEWIEAEIAPRTVMNRSIGGETTVMMLSSIDADVLALSPSVIFLSIGGNDLLGGRCIGRIKENVGLILFKIHAKLPRTHVILAGVPPVLSWKVNSVSPYLNGMLRDLAAENASFVEYFDLWDILADPDRPVLQKRFERQVPVELTALERLAHSQPYATDRIHFNEAGYREIAKRLKPVLQRLASQKPALQEGR